MEEKEKDITPETEEEVKASSEQEETPPEPTELEKAEAALAAERDKYLRLAAEYDNFRKRTAREKEALYGDATAAAISAFLAVYDNMERACSTPSEDESYKKGVELILPSSARCLRT